MTGAVNPRVYFRSVLGGIDKRLASQDVSIQQRPLLATVDFVTHFVIEVKRGDQTVSPAGSQAEFMLSPWFALIFAEVRTWYEELYGEAMRHDRKDKLLGAIAIAGTVFSIQVPVMNFRPGEQKGTGWIGFPDGLRDGEDPLAWLTASPNLDRFEVEDRTAAEEEAEFVASSLRSIYSGLLGIAATDDKLAGLTYGIMPRLEQAAQSLEATKAGRVQQAYWEMHLACEHALKALQQQSGSFQKTHDLLELYDGIQPPPGFPRNLLDILPGKNEVMKLRYGQGVRNDRSAGMKNYRCVLQIVAGTVASMKNVIGLGRAEFLIQAPPWATVS